MTRRRSCHWGMRSQCSKPVTPGATGCQWRRSAASREQAEDIALEKRRVHAELQGEGSAESSLYGLEELAEERRRLLGVVDVAGPVLEPQDVAGLRHVGEKGVVTEILAMVGVEAAEGPADRRAGADDGAIDVERKPGQVQAREGVEHNLLVESAERPERVVTEPAQPIGDRARRRQPGEPTEAADERIADEILQMLHAPGPDVEEGEQHQAQPRSAVVPAQWRARALQSVRQPEPADIAPEQLQAAVRRELLGHELDRQIPLDHSPQAAYAQAHQRGLRELRDDMGMSALWIRWKAPLIHTDLALTPSVFSDWG